MEHVALNNVQLDYLARDDPQLKPMFYGTVACDRLPKRPVKTQRQGYIVNTDPHDQPGQHWLAVWTEGNVCEVLDSYALPMDTYVQAAPLRDWIVQHWKYVVTNGKSLQAISSKSCGDYALLYLKAKARGRTLQDFLNEFSDHDYVSNDHQAGQCLQQLIVGQEARWYQLCCHPYHQRNGQIKFVGKKVCRSRSSVGRAFGSLEKKQV